MLMSAVRIKKGGEDIAVNLIVTVISVFILIMSIYPVYFCLISSFSDGQATFGNPAFLLPKQPTLDNYKAVLRDPSIGIALITTVLRTVIGTLTSVFFTAMVAYAFSKDYLMYRKVYMIFFVITMYFGGGVIPTYLVYKSYGLVNTFSVYIVPGLLGVFNMILFMNFFKSLPNEVIEAAQIDGVGEFSMIFKIVLPLSRPIFATIMLFNGVGHWNDWFTTAYYTTSDKLMTLSALLMKLVTSADAQRKLDEFIRESGLQIGGARINTGVTADSVRYATLLVSIVPILLVYPFLQKYFEKGIMLGAVKS